MAAKYELDDNTKVETLSLLTIRNPRMGHFHAAKVGEGRGSVGGSEPLQSLDRKDRLAEYHKLTNERRKQINAKVQKRRDKEQKEAEEATKAEESENKAKLNNAGRALGAG